MAKKSVFEPFDKAVLRAYDHIKAKVINAQPDREDQKAYEQLKAAFNAKVERSELAAKISELEAEIAEQDRSFELRWKSDMRAIKMWQEKNPGNDLVWPDHAKLVVWLLEHLDTIERELLEIFREANDLSNEVSAKLSVRQSTTLVDVVLRINEILQKGVTAPKTEVPEGKQTTNTPKDGGPDHECG